MIIKFTTLLLPIITLLSISCSNQSTKLDHSKTTASSNFAERALETKILYYANIERAKYGRKPVKAHSGLANIARRHSDFTAKNEGKFQGRKHSVSHIGFNSRAKLARSKFNLGTLAENVHTTWSTNGNLANRIIQGWMNSPKHRDTILGKSYTYCGIGIRQKGSGTFSTMLMATHGNNTPQGTEPQSR